MHFAFDLFDFSFDLLLQRNFKEFTKSVHWQPLLSSVISELHCFSSDGKDSQNLQKIISLLNEKRKHGTISKPRRAT